jgi:hypothetical protein
MTLTLDWSRCTAPALLRGVAAGTLWGVAVAGFFLGRAFLDCGMVCVDDVVMTGSTCILAGVLIIGPLAAFGRRPD